VTDTTTTESRRRSGGHLALLAMLLVGLTALPASADVTLVDYPQEMVGVDEYVTITWEETVRCRMAYGRLPGVYTSVTDVDGWESLGFTPESEGMTPGVYYCVLQQDGTGDESEEFVLVVESPIFPTPVTPLNGGVVSSSTTTLSWEPVMGVPFYHVLVSDHPIEIEENEEGDIVVTGANIIWQAITGGTSIQYGAPDPSGHFTETNGASPPLMSDLEYNWLVLNNFGNHPLMTSVAGAGVAGFTVDVDVALDPPTPTSPPSDVVIAEDFLDFDWQPVAGAASYHLYLYEERTWDAGDASYPIWDGATGESTLEVNLGNFLVSGEYSWRVLALDGTGRGRPSELRSFEYATETGTAHIESRRESGGPLPRVLVEIERTDSGLEALPAITNESGIFNRDLMPGEYRFHASRADYADTTVTATIREGDVTNVTLTLRRAPARVRGFVRDEDGVPVFGAEVNGTSGDAAADATTDAGGSFVLDVTSGSWSIAAAKTGYAPSETVAVELDAGDYLELPDPLVLTGTPGFASGSVVNTDGNPIVGATVRATSPVGEVVGATGGSGHFRLQLAPGPWDIVAEKSGFRPSEVRTLTIEPDAETSVEPPLSLLPIESAVLGRVSDGTFGVAGATVVAAPPSGGTITATTNTRGEFVLLPPPGTYSLTASGDGFCPSDRYQVTVEGGASFTGVELVVGAPECTFEGVVTDGSDPVAGAVVSAGTVETMTGPGGAFSLGLPAGIHELRARKPGHASGTPLVVAAGQGETVDGIELRVTPGAATIEGTVEAGGLPVPFALVEAFSRGARVAGRTDTEGAFELAVEAGVWEVSAWKRGFAASPPETLDVVPGQSVSDVLLAPTPSAARLRGAVTDAAGAVRRASLLFFQDGAAGPARRTSSGSNGIYAVLLSPGIEYTMVVSADGHAETALTVGPFAAGADEMVDLELPIRSGALAGVVTDDVGRPVGGATVRSDDSGASTRTDGMGRYTLWLDGGTHDIVVRAPGYIERSFPSTSVPSYGTAALDCSLDDIMATVAGTVTDSLTGEPVDGVLTTIAWGDGGRSSVTDPTGAYGLESVVPGEADIMFSRPGYRAKAFDLSVVGDAWLDLDVELFGYSGSISGLVVRDDGTPLSGATVRASEDGIVVSAGTSSGDGGFLLGGLDPDGFYDLTATLTGHYATTANPLEDVPAGTGDATFRLEPCTGTIQGTVTDAVSDEPLAGARVTADDGSGHSGSASTGEDGSFLIEDLPPVGLYSVEAELYGYHPGAADSVSPVAGTVDFALGRNFARLEGHLTALGELSVDEVSIVATNTSYAGYSREVACPMTGDYAIDEVRPGSYVVTISGDGCLGAPLQETVTAGEGQTVTGIDFTVERPPVEAIQISGPDEIVAGGAATFSGSALTDEGQLVDTSLEWWVSPAEAGSMNRAAGRFEAAPDYIGEASIGAYDSMSGLRGTYGTSVFVTVSPAAGASVSDSLGMRLEIPAGAVTEDQPVSLRHETLPDAKRLGRGFEISGASCHLMPDGLELGAATTLAMPAAGAGPELVRWNEDRLAWERIEAMSIGGELEGTIDRLGEYAVAESSRELGIWDLDAEPNPFSPDQGPVSIAFDVSSTETRSPFVTLRIRNVEGRLVRTVAENEAVPRGRVELTWDGLADSGRAARNGRYIIEIIVEDAGAEETVLGTVVLVK